MGIYQHLYFVTYDLVSESGGEVRDCSPLVAALEKLGGYKVTESCWFVKFSGSDSDELVSSIEAKIGKGFIRGSDKFVVGKIGSFGNANVSKDHHPEEYAIDDWLMTV